MSGIQFDEDIDPTVTRLTRIKAPNSVVKAGIVREEWQANLLLLFLALAMVAGIVFFLRTSLPPEKKLGNDVPRLYEIIPENRTL